MKKITTIALTLLALAQVAASPAGAENKVVIGYVNMQRALENSAAGQEATKNLNDLWENYKVSIQAEKEKIETLKAEIDKQSLLWNQKTLREKEDELRLLERDYNRLLKDIQDEIKRKESNFSESISKSILKIINDIGESEGYTIILEKKSSAILYAPDSIDITDKVIKTFDSQKQ